MAILRRARRSWRLMGILGAMAVLAVALFVAAMPAGARDNGRVDGSYLIDGQSAVDHHTFQVVAAFASGGTYSGIVSDDPGVEVGQWSLTDDHEVVATFYSFAFGPNGAPAGTVTVHITSKVRSGSITGTYEATGTTPTGGELFPPDHGSFTGHRIKAGG